MSSHPPLAPSDAAPLARPARGLAPLVALALGLLGLGCSPAAAPTEGEATVALAGDVHGEPPIAEVVAAGGNPLAAVAPTLSRADLAVVNLETPVGDTGSPADKAFVFRADAALLERLVEAGVDVANLANNHGLDFGPQALLQTLTLAEEAGLAVVGAGPDAASAYAPALFDTPGGQVAVLGLTQLLDDPEWAAGAQRPGLASAADREAAVAAVEAAATVADHVIVTIHWGQELAVCPTREQVRLADRLVAAGADVIAGHHPHVLQGIHQRDGALVAYSLGNYAFYARTAETTTTATLVVSLGAAGVAGYRLEPAMIDDRGQPQPLEGAAAAAVEALVRTRSPGGGTCHTRTWG